MKAEPLTALLARVWVAQTIEIDNAFEAKGAAAGLGRHFRISLPLWTNGLRHIDDDGITLGELRSRARAACNIGGLERWGWITVGTPGSRREGYGTSRHLVGDTVLRLSPAGVRASELWPRAVAEVEERWRERFGDEHVTELHAALTDVVTPMPWSPPEVSPADGFRTHIVDSDLNEPDPPLVALAGMVLAGRTIAHERESAVSLPLAANFLRVIGEDVVRLRDLPAMAGVSKEAVAMAVGFLTRTGRAVAGPERSLHLTPEGLDALADYREGSATPVCDRLRAVLDAVLARADALAEGLEPPEGCWRGERPYLTQTRRFLSDPKAALPWQPMVLHRGSWPDGS